MSEKFITFEKPPLTTLGQVITRLEDIKTQYGDVPLNECSVSMLAGDTFEPDIKMRRFVISVSVYEGRD